METVYYTLTARGIEVEGELEQVAGGTRRVMLVRSPKTAPRRGAENNVVSLAAWKAERELAEQDFEDEVREPERAWDDPREPEAGTVSRRGGFAGKVLLTGEVLATLSVLCVAAALLYRILVF